MIQDEKISTYCRTWDFWRDMKVSLINDEPLRLYWMKKYYKFFS